MSTSERRSSVRTGVVWDAVVARLAADQPATERPGESYDDLELAYVWTDSQQP